VPAVRFGPVIVWVLGVVVYHTLPKVLPAAGGALPSLAFTLAAGAVLAYRSRRTEALGA
jgi:hypothetical protein